MRIVTFQNLMLYFGAWLIELIFLTKNTRFCPHHLAPMIVFPILWTSLIQNLSSYYELQNTISTDARKYRDICD